MDVRSHPEAGVVIATRDRRETLLHSLSRLVRLPERPRVVVVDNGSRDDTPDAVRAAFPSVEVIELGRDLGAAARTTGARRLRTPLVAFNDDDSWWAPGALEAAGNAFGAHPQLGLLAADVLVGPGRRRDPTSAEMAETPLRANGDLPGPAVLGFLACGAVVRRRAFLDVGGFQARLGIGGEEELLAIDLAVAGWHLAYVPAVVAHHHPVAGERKGRRRTQLRNALWLAWLRRPLGTAVRRTASVARTAGRDADARMALLGAIRGLPWVVRSRRVVPAAVERQVELLELS